jgi:hypothetical protein
VHLFDIPQENTIEKVLKNYQDGKVSFLDIQQEKVIKKWQIKECWYHCDTRQRYGMQTLVEKRSTRYLVVADETMLTETKLPTFV